MVYATSLSIAFGYLRSEKDVNSAQHASDFKRYLSYTSARRLRATHGQAKVRPNRLKRLQRHRVRERAIVRFGNGSSDTATEGMSFVVDCIRDEMRVPATIFSDMLVPSEDGVGLQRASTEV